ncbi:uncharacterized protein V6R79_017555 [Siganus canaliculatus]
METAGDQVENTDIFLPLSSLRLLIPPLRLLSAAMWQTAQRREVLDYEKLDEFVTLVTATVPDLLSAKQRGKLLLRLRAKVILELCRNEATANFLQIQPHLDRIRPAGHTGSGDAEVDAEEAIFVELIQTLLKDPAERDHFYQALWLLLIHLTCLICLIFFNDCCLFLSKEVFPTEYGLSYDTDMQLLVWEFLSRLEKLLPVPDLSQTVSWLTSAPSVLRDCWQALSSPDDLRSLLQHHKCLEHLGTQGTTVEMSTQVFACSECPFFHMQESFLLQHIEHSHPEQCSKLQKSAGTALVPKSKTIQQIVVEEETAERDGGQYKCQKCGESFGSILERLRHRQRHAVRRQYKCPLCEKVYSRASDLKRHQMKHTGERPFACECGKRFTHVWLLNKHQQIHAKERPYPCGECGKSFTQLQILNRHLLTHNGQRPFQCSYCEKSFTQQASLTRHERIHTGERPYGCTTCDKTFLTHGELVRHQRSHSNFRSFCCPQCPKSFKTRRAQREHLNLQKKKLPCNNLSVVEKFQSSTWEASNTVCESDTLCDPAVLVSATNSEPHIRNRRLSPGSGNCGGGGGGGCISGSDQQPRQLSPDGDLIGPGHAHTFSFRREKERKGQQHKGRSLRRESQKGDSPAKLQPAVSYASKVKAGATSGALEEDRPAIGVLLQNQWGLSFISEARPATEAPSTRLDSSALPPQPTDPDHSVDLQLDTVLPVQPPEETPTPVATSSVTPATRPEVDESNGKLLLSCRHLMEALTYHSREWNALCNKQKKVPKKVVWYKDVQEHPA